MLTPWKESYDQPRQHIKKQRHYFTNKGPSGQGYGFSSANVWMWELGCEECWALKNWCFWTVVLEKTLECPLDCKEIQPVHPNGHQCWVFIGRTDAEAASLILWPPHAKSWLIGKDPDAWRDWGQEEKRTTEDEMAGWHHRLDGHEFEWTPGVGDGQGGLVCCDSWGCKESDTTEQLNWTELIVYTCNFCNTVAQKVKNLLAMQETHVQSMSPLYLHCKITACLYYLILKRLINIMPKCPKYYQPYSHLKFITGST